MNYIQLEHAYHFSQDALLLANFAYGTLVNKYLKKRRGVTAPFYLLDLGCGCGVVGLEILRLVREQCSARSEDVYILGIDNKPELVENALENAKKFNFEKQYKAICLDIIDVQRRVGIKESKALKKRMLEELFFSTPSHCSPLNAASINEKENSGISKNPRVFDMVISNPPWYLEEKGKVTESSLRKNALFGGENIEYFLCFADTHLKDRGSFCLVGKPKCFLSTVQKMPQELDIVTIQNVYSDIYSQEENQKFDKTMQNQQREHNQQNKDAIFFLAEARRKSKADLRFLTPKYI